MIVIVDFGLGNLRSIQSKLERLGYSALISNDEAELSQATKFILPGVGHFSAGMRNLQKHGLKEVLDRRVLDDKVPILGICLGMQLFASHSEEGDMEGLGWIQAKVKKFYFAEATERLRVPHVGWNKIKPKKESDLFTDVSLENRFYFTHSYYVECDDEQDLLAETSYGGEFASAVQRENIFGTQFHPEKSRKYGLQIIDNFLKYSA